MIVDDDMSDEDIADENIVSLSSPELPKEKLDNPILSEKNGKQLDAPVQHLKELKGDSADIVLDKKKKPEKAISKAEETNKSTKVANDGATTSAPEAKKRKVLKTRIVERGREVTEVVWETENPMTSDDEKCANGTDGHLLRWGCQMLQVLGLWGLRVPKLQMPQCKIQLIKPVVTNQLGKGHQRMVIREESPHFSKRRVDIRQAVTTP